MKLIITRHGETIENKKLILQGHLGGTLSKEGIEQAKRVAERLKKEKIDAIYSSDLARAADTAKEIGKFHPKIRINFVKELRERDIGEFQGKTKEEVDWDEIKSGKFNVTNVQPKKGESLESLYQRASRFVDKIIHQHPNDTVLFVGHNVIVKAIILVITRQNVEKIFKMDSLKNTSITIYEIDEDKNHKIHLFNCIKHLA